MNPIVQKVLQGDRDAFRHIVREYGPGIRAFLAGHLTDPATVEDLAQETFIATFESLERFDPQADLGHWIRRIAKNRLLMHLRRLYQSGKTVERLKAQILQEAVESSLAAGDEPSLLDKLRQCLEKLPEHVRSVIRARHLEHVRVTELARKMDTTEIAVSSLLFRGRKQLEACMEGRK